MIDEIIKIVVAKAGFKKYSLTHGIFTQPDWSSGLKLHNDIAIVYRFAALVNISDISRFTTENVVKLISPERTVDYKHMVLASEVSNAVQLTSDYVSVHRSELSVDVTDAVWNDIYTGHFAYILIRREE